MLFYIYKSPQKFKPNDFIECIFDGRELKTFFNGQEINSHKTTLGTAFYVHPQGQKKLPIINFPKMPESRGEKIAWFLSFIGDEKYVSTEEEFYNMYEKLLHDETITNMSVFIKYGRFSIIIADRHLPEKNKTKKNNPVLAWITDDITRQELNDLFDKYESVKNLPCARKFFYHL